MDAEVDKLAAAESRLREVIADIVRRRTSRNVPLSWRLMFEIEDEALSLLQHDPELDLRYLDMMASPTAQRHAGNDEPAGLSDVYAMHTALWMIQEAYCRAHAHGVRPADHSHSAKNKTARSAVIPGMS
ncbi:DUF2471 family protein [Noviherbaspirillum sp.]|uniref:DUF2471 family protein n=1 Tax=Noviherbaspirillum sp. TaxID=1926288 RepID=UPI002B4886C6|nr:hypothetical protein [Noviherbaspirillum sp.]HJV80865.1 hypothetical protein [Noviherbaspirillum sp.]